MIKPIAYAYLKTIDGEEVMEYTKEEFENLSQQVKFKKITKSDRSLYFLIDTTSYNNIKYFKNDYFEVKN